MERLLYFSYSCYQIYTMLVVYLWSQWFVIQSNSGDPESRSEGLQELLMNNSRFVISVILQSDIVILLSVW